MNVSVYEMEHSPFCIPVTQALTALGVEFDRIPVSNWDRSLVIDVTGGYYQVPVLRHEDKVVAESNPDSQDIPKYIDKAFANGRLFPENNAGLQSILIRYIENEIEAVTFKAVDAKYLPDIGDPVARAMTVRHKERKFGPGCVEAWSRDIGDLRSAAEALFLPFEQTLRHSPFVLGDSPCYADFSLFGVVGNYEYRNYNTLPSDFTAMREWNARLEKFRF